MSEIEQTSPECLICRKHKEKTSAADGLIYEDETVYIGHLLPSQQPWVYLGYLMVESKRHVPEVSGLTDHEAQMIGLWVARLSRALKASEKAEHVYVFVIGDHVPHVHFHVVPRYPGAPREYWNVKVDEWPDAPRGGLTEIAALCSRVRAVLER